MKPIALITGVTGQDGSYAADLLLSKGYQVHGYTRNLRKGLGCSAHLQDALSIHSFDPGCQRAWEELLAAVQPTEIYHFAANSFVPHSWSDPLGNNDANLSLTIRLLEAIRHHSPHSKLLYACSREVFARPTADVGAAEIACHEDSQMQPATPYGISKASARWMVSAYREAYGMFAVSALLFNHESPRRSQNFVTRKVSHGVAAIASGQQDRIELGNLAARRDWGYAADFVDGMWRMLQHPEPHDFVLGTGQLHSVEQLLDFAFRTVGLRWQDHVAVNKDYLRHADETAVRADTTKARQLLGWTAQTELQQLMEMMVNHDLGLMRGSRRMAA